jgi:transketolase
MIASHLVSGIAEGTIERTPTRFGYGEGLLEAGKREERVVALCADLTESTRTHQFAEAFPKRFIQIGIAEQNMASVASGMAAMGKIPFMASYAVFSPGRNWEQIRTTIAYNNSNVKIIGAHAGISVGPDGATHQAIEDIALMRVIPNMVVIAPVDIHEARKATLLAARYDGPVYIRVGRSETPVITTIETPFEIGVALPLYTSQLTQVERRIGMVVTGTLGYYAIKAAESLEAEGIGVNVIHMPTIKPLDEQALCELAEQSTELVTIEEHQITAGLGGAVAEYISGIKPIKITRIGIRDEFGQSGEPDELLHFYKLDTEGILAQVR